MQCIAENNSAGFSKEESMITYRDVYSGKSLAQLRRQMGGQELTKVIFAMFNYLQAYMNIISAMSNEQIISMVNLLMNEYPTETLEDIIIFIKNIKLGRYGPVYNRLDGQMILCWYRQYMEQKQDYIDECRAEEKSKMIAGSNEVLKALFSNCGLKIELPKPKQETINKKQETLERRISMIKQTMHLFTDKELEDMIAHVEFNLHTCNTELMSILRHELEKRTMTNNQ